MKGHSKVTPAISPHYLLSSSTKPIKSFCNLGHGNCFAFSWNHSDRQRYYLC